MEGTVLSAWDTSYMNQKKISVMMELTFSWEKVDYK